MKVSKRRFYSTQDVMEILGISKSKANQLMHMFEFRGQLFRDGRVMRVRIKDFEQWLKERESECMANDQAVM